MYRHHTIPAGYRQRFALALSAALLIPIAANAAPPVEPPLGKELLNAMRRDLGLDAQQAAQYVRTERAAIELAPRLKSDLGAAYAGSWLERGKDGQFKLVAAATDAAAAAKARALGAEIRVVARSLAQLEVAKSRLDTLNMQRKAAAGIHSWYIDVKRNQIVIEGHPKAQQHALEFAIAAGSDASALRFVASEAEPKLAQIVGGERYNLPGGGWCSIGFPVTRGADTGFATAGHCGTVGTATTGTNGVAQGVFDGSNFPGADSAWVRITNPGAWPLRNWVNNYAGGTVPIAGQAQAAVGAAICRSGATTGYRCGTVNANNVTVNYAAGAVFGLTSTSACVGFGDSGGAYITPAGQAQGVTSGGLFFAGTNDNCASNPPTSYHQPIGPLLNQYGLTLFTGGGGAVPPTITAFACPLDNGGGRFYCFAQFTPAAGATVSWTGAAGSTFTDNGYSDFYGRCGIGSNVRVTITVTNANGSASRSSATFTCRGGPVIL